MIIELIGLPGVGKSYLCGRLHALVAQRALTGVKTTPRVDGISKLNGYSAKLARAAKFVLRHPATALKIRRIARASGQSDSRQLLTKTINLFSELGRSSGKDGSVLVSEQGVIQAVWSLAFRARESVAADLLEAVQPWLPEAVVIVECQLEKHLSRLLARATGQSRIDRLQREELEDELDRGRHLFREILDICESLHPSGKVFRVSNDDESGAEELLSSIGSEMAGIGSVGWNLASRVEGGSG